MRTDEACKCFGITIGILRKITRVLEIKSVIVGKARIFSNMDIARIKAGIEYKDYAWAQDQERFWIWYGFSPCGQKEIKIEI